MISEVAVCNLALAHLGCAGIADLAEQSEAARQCRTHYEPALAAALAGHDWPFALRYMALAEKTTCPPGWSHAYQAPSDCLRVVAIMDREGPRTPPPAYEMGYGHIIMTDVSNAWARYVAQVDDPARWPAQFLQAMTWRLAADLAMPLTGDRGRFNDASQMFEHIMASARAAALNEGQRAPVPDAVWISAR